LSVEPVAPERQRAEVGVHQPVDDGHELLPALAVPEHQEPLLERDVEDVDEVALGQRVEPAGQRVGEVGAGRLPRAAPGKVTTKRWPLRVHGPSSTCVSASPAMRRASDPSGAPPTPGCGRRRPWRPRS
jgi:hypothetical protein